MKGKYLILSGATAALVLAAGVAFAQTTTQSTPVNVTTTPSTSGVTPGQNGTAFGTITLSGNNGGTYSVASLPITVTPSSGASASNLSNCQLYNSNGSALNTGSNIPTIGSGSNTFTFDTPLQVTNSAMTLTIKCNVSNSATSGQTYQFMAGTPVLSGGLNVMVTTPTKVAAGSANAALALITLDGTRSGQSINVSSIPVTLTLNGASANELTNCSLRNATNLGTALNTGAHAIGTWSANGAQTTINLDTPLTVTPGSIQVLALTCNVASVTPVGSTVMVSVTPASVQASNASTNAAVTPGTSTIAATGGVAPTSGMVTISAVGTGTTTGGTTVPGTPNTGAGGNAAIDLAILAASGAILLLGGRALALRFAK